MKRVQWEKADENMPYGHKTFLSWFARYPGNLRAVRTDSLLASSILVCFLPPLRTPAWGKP